MARMTHRQRGQPGRVLPAACRLLLALTFLLAVAVRTISADTDGQELPNFASMRVKELKALLDQRGVTCEGCAEKTELVARVKETYHMPVLPEAEAAKKSVPPDAEATKATSKDDVMEMLKNLKRPDGSGFQVFGKDDLEKLRKEMEAKGGPMKNGDHKEYNADL